MHPIHIWLRIIGTNECNTATKRQQPYVLANKRHGVGAHVTICKNILFFGVEAAVQRTHANKVTRAFEKGERKHTCFQAMTSHTCAKHRSSLLQTHNVRAAGP